MSSYIEMKGSNLFIYQMYRVKVIFLRNGLGDHSSSPGQG